MAMTEARETVEPWNARAGASSVLSLLRARSPQSRRELAVSTGASRASVVSWLAGLQDLGLVRETESSVYSGGRPTSQFELCPESLHVAALDIAPFETKWALVDLSGRPAVDGTVPTVPETRPESVIDTAIRAVQKAASGRRVRIAAVGVGIAAPVDFATGKPITPPAMPEWSDFDIRRRIATHLDVPVVVDKHSTMMLIADQNAEDRGFRNMLYVTLSEAGIGGAMLSNGQIYRGENGTAGDIGHVAVSGSTVTCRCGSVGCLEAEAATPALLAKLAEAGVTAVDSADFARLVRSGNVDAIRIAREAGRQIGQVLSSYVSIVNPRAIVLSGELASAGNHLLAEVRGEVYGRSFALATAGLEIMIDEGWQRKGLLGAAFAATTLALEELVR